MRTYAYVGPAELLAILDQASSRRMIQSATDVLDWAEDTHQQLDSENQVIATFIIDSQGKLWIADRHSEHVVCAQGGPVQSAGEMTFRVTKGEVEVTAVTNQSTGFCPEPNSWPCVATSLDKANLPHPADFTTKFQFRFCTDCSSINLIKEDWFVCGVCDAELSRNWNFKWA